MNVTTDLWTYVVALCTNVWLDVTGAIAGVAFVVEKVFNLTIQVPRRLLLGIFAVMLFLSSFSVWREEHERARIALQPKINFLDVFLLPNASVDPERRPNGTIIAVVFAELINPGEDMTFDHYKARAIIGGRLVQGEVGYVDRCFRTVIDGLVTDYKYTRDSLTELTRTTVHKNTSVKGLLVLLFPPANPKSVDLSSVQISLEDTYGETFYSYPYGNPPIESARTVDGCVVVTLHEAAITPGIGRIIAMPTPRVLPAPSPNAIHSKH